MRIHLDSLRKHLWTVRVCYGVAVLIAVSMLVLMFVSRRVPNLSWDLSSGNGIDTVGWPDELSSDSDDGSNDYWGLDGPLDMTLKLPNTAMFSGRVSGVWMHRQKRDLMTIKLLSEDLTLKDACSRAKTLILQYGGEPETLEAWSKEAATNEGGIGTFEKIFDTADLEVAIAIRHSFGQSRPWFVTCDFYFGPRNEELILQLDSK